MVEIEAHAAALRADRERGRGLIFCAFGVREPTMAVAEC